MFVTRDVGDLKAKMTELTKSLKSALDNLRKEKKRKFTQSVDLVVNLQKFDLKKNNLNFFVNIPHKIKDKKIAGFLSVKNNLVETITPEKFKNYSDKNKLKKLVKEFDFFISEASLMPKVASTFGRALGPAGKMPSPQLGIIPNTNDKAIEELKQRINNNIKIRAKESSIKLQIGKENMQDSEIIENIKTIYNALVKNLPRDKENIKNIEIKFTMSKPQKIDIK